MSYKCPKCDNTTYDIGEMRATGGTLSKIFDVQNKKFTSVTCKNCA
jgi:predicted nucleic-acid-binding Zn-ribbon protein